MLLSVCIVTHNEEANIARTLESVKDIADEVVIVDSHSTDNTVAVARSRGAKVFIEDWKGFAVQKNSALAKASGEWILSLDADEEVNPELAAGIKEVLRSDPPAQKLDGYYMARRNLYLKRWIKHGGYYPDRKLRLVKRSLAKFELRAVHEDIKLSGPTGLLRGDLIHHAYPDLEGFIEHANRYSSLGAKMVVEERRVGFSVTNIVFRPLVRFFYNYVLRGGFLDGREGLLVHLTHAAYVSWKFSKAWEYSKEANGRGRESTSTVRA
ncbi:MAG TPA: glycosyltransferase family 2 protein [Candidatus Acidoferrales bacterium]|nr:glycosyltransferase family 2 protein [Candidatus Acidoferrales bacterium]